MNLKDIGGYVRREIFDWPTKRFLWVFGWWFVMGPVFGFLGVQTRLGGNMGPAGALVGLISMGWIKREEPEPDSTWQPPPRSVDPGERIRARWFWGVVAVLLVLFAAYAVLDDMRHHY
jgi:hypothetical protein